MRALLILFAVIVGMCIALSAVHFADARVLLVVPPYTVQMAFNFFVLLLLVLVVIILIVLRVLAYLLHLPASLSAMNQARKQKNAMHDFEYALLSIAEGRHQKAISFLSHLAQTPWFVQARSYWLAQQYHVVGQKDKRDAVLTQLMGIPEAQLLYTILSASFALDDGRWARAQEILLPKGVEDLSAPAFMPLLLRFYRAEARYREVLRLLGLMEKKGVTTHMPLAEIKEEAYLYLIEHLSDSAAFDSFYKQMPKVDQKQYQSHMITRAIALGYFSFARDQIEMALSVEWRRDLILQYSQCGEDALVHQLEYAEAYLQQYPTDDALLLCLGRLCKKNKLWGKAHQYFEAALSIRPSDALRLELAALLEECGEHDKARLIFRQIAVFHS